MSPRIPLTELLMDYIDGRLGAEDRSRVEQMLTQSDLARRRMAWLTDFREQAQQTSIDEPPGTLRATLMETYRRLRQVHASEVLHDSREAVAGVRSVGTAERWAIIHTSDVADIAIDFARVGDRVEVSGQVLTIDDRACRGVELMSATESLCSVRPDHYGQFSCGVVPTGSHRLLVHLQDATVTVDIEVDEDPTR